MTGLILRVMPLLVAGGAATGGKDKLTQLGDKAMNAVLQLKTSMELRGIVKMIRLDMIHGSQAPADLEAYIRENIDSQGTDPTLDAWGTPYELTDDHDGALLIVSFGPDKEFDTEDDIEAMVHDSRGRFRGRSRR